MELTLTCQTIGIHLLRQIRREGFRGQVHSVFRRACNLITEDGQLFSLGVTPLGSSASGLLVFDSGRVAPFDSLRPGDLFYALGENLILAGPLGIDLSQAAIWSPTPAWGSPRKMEEIVGNLALARQALNSATAIANWGDTMERIKAAAPLLQHSFQEGDPQKAAQAAQGILGVGPGLTPSGDDFLTGWISSFHWGAAALGLKDARFVACIGAIVSLAKTRTHLISYAQLVNASAGELPEKIQTLQLNLYHACDDGAVKESIEQVLNIGHTSGRDILMGMVAAAESLLKIVNPEWERAG